MIDWKLVNTWYNIITVVNCTKLYKAMYLKSPKLVTRAHLPSLTNSRTQLMFGIHDVNGAAIDASACDNDIPTCAAFSAWRQKIKYIILSVCP